MNLPKILFFETLASTSDWVREHLENLDVPTAVAARQQTAGKGRRGRSWESAPGGLYFTLLFRSPLPIALHPSYAQIAAIALAEWISRFGIVPELKWPNDLLIGGAKTAGILLDAVGHGEERKLLLGVGLNLNRTPEGVDRPVTSLGKILNRTFPLEETLDDLLPVLLRSFDRYEKEGMPPFAEAFRRFDRLIGTRQTILLGEKRIEGEVVGVNDAGALLFCTADGEHLTVWSGELSI